jgi:putative component of membrane protein insertase Oxa1/YidC/SpoIIIJ protein YidD
MRNRLKRLIGRTGSINRSSSGTPRRHAERRYFSQSPGRASGPRRCHHIVAGKSQTSEKIKDGTHMTIVISASSASTSGSSPPRSGQLPVYPACSHYAAGAVESTVPDGPWYAVRRILRCHPSIREVRSGHRVPAVPSTVWERHNGSQHCHRFHPHRLVLMVWMYMNAPPRRNRTGVDTSRSGPGPL